MILITGYKTGKKYYINSSKISSMTIELEDRTRKPYTLINLTADVVGKQVFGVKETPKEILSKLDLLALIGLTNMETLRDEGV